MVERFIGKEMGPSYKHGSDPVEVSPELFRLDKKVDMKDVEKRIEYLGLESNKSTRIQCEAEISSYKKRINDTIHIIVSNFMLDIARKFDWWPVGISVLEGEPGVSCQEKNRGGQHCNPVTEFPASNKTSPDH